MNTNAIQNKGSLGKTACKFLKNPFTRALKIKQFISLSCLTVRLLKGPTFVLFVGYFGVEHPSAGNITEAGI